MSAFFTIRFSDPPRVTVKEEYLIYDMVSMISAIGGTMGLCIGLSFLDIYSISLGLVQNLYRQIQRQYKRKKQIDCQPDPVVNVSVEEQKSTGKNELSMARLEKRLGEIENFASELANCVKKIDASERRISKQGI